MTEQLKHECGIVLLRLLKPLEFYKNKYGSNFYGLQKLYLLMEKQHNRGQDGAGVVSINLNNPPGNTYIFRERSNNGQPIKEVFDNIRKRYVHGENKQNETPETFQTTPFLGEVMLGHLRYGTFGKNDIENVHPVMRQNNWRSRNLVLAGNFNLTNVDELIQNLINIGQHPKDYSDTVTMLENIGHYLDEENQGLFDLYKKRGYAKKDISPLIEKNLDIKNILKASSKHWDGGYVIAGLIGHGDAFVLRDPAGIRPAFYYRDDEILVVTSERPVIQTVFNVEIQNIREIKPGHAVIIKKNGEFFEESIHQATQRRSCSFERIYFSRGTDTDIYRERKKLGELITPAIIETLGGDIENTVFSYIPNTAETAFYGMIKAVEHHLIQQKKDKILQCGNNLSDKELTRIMAMSPRVEKIAVKDAKLRTFITQDEDRNDLVEHVYDITYGTIVPHVDNLVIIDDSIVRGTTLEKSVIRILDRLHPKQILIASSSPQIRYPDCYGIDMTKMGEFIAFRAAVELLKESGRISLLNDVYKKCKEQINLPKEQVINFVKEIYLPFTDPQISDKISQMVTSENIGAKVKIIFQTIDNLHNACPNDMGDWYFTGNYPTPGGNKVVNTAFINYMEGKTERAY